MPPKRSEPRKTGRVKAATTTRSPSSSEAHADHPKLLSLLSLSPSLGIKRRRMLHPLDLLMPLPQIQMSGRDREPSQMPKKKKAKTHAYLTISPWINKRTGLTD